MPDANAKATSAEHNAETPVAPQANKARLPFRRRLMLTLGAALAVVFLVLGVASWFAFYGWLNYQARMELKQEGEEIIANIISPGGRLRVQRYAWYEPHHRFKEQRIDPYFVQIFDTNDRLLRASDNIHLFPEGRYPARLLTRKTTPASSLRPLSTFRLDGTTMYFDVLPLQRGEGAVMGYVQVARYEPGIEATLRRFTLLLLSMLSLLLTGLLLLIRRIASRILGPLDSITKATQQISPRRLNQRIAVPDEADRETDQLANTLNTLLHRLEHAFEEMQRFTANAAHELQTPLTVLRGHVEVALRRPRSAASYQETLHLLAGEIDMMTRMVRGLLLLARLDRDHDAHHAEALDLTALVQETASKFEKPAQAKGLTLSVHAEEAMTVRGHRDLLHEALINVLDNALKYTPQGSITIRLERQAERAIVTVTDTGIGITPEALAHVTDRFYRAPSVQSLQIEGNGLGLALVPQIVTLHDGTFQIDSVPEEGTTVVLTFPLQVATRHASTSLTDVSNSR